MIIIWAGQGRPSLLLLSKECALSLSFFAFFKSFELALLLSQIKSAMNVLLFILFSNNGHPADC